MDPTESKKHEVPFSSKDVEGYIHKVSEVKNPPSGHRYFDFKVQERNDEKRVVCFNPTKRREFTDFEKNKSPVKLLCVSPQKRKYQPDITEYKMTNNSKIAATKNLSFPWKDLQSEGNKDTNVKCIQERYDSGDIVSLNGKVVWKSENAIVFSAKMKKELHKCDIVVADPTGAITITLWELNGDDIDVDSSYSFGNFKVGFYKKKCLNSTITSSITKLDEDVELTVESQATADDLKPQEKATKTVYGNIIGLEVKKMFICMNCKNKLSAVADDAKIMKCPNCKIHMRRDTLNGTVSANVLIAEDKQIIGRFFASTSVLNAMFSSIAKTENYNINASDVSDLTEEMLVETLLLIENGSFELVLDDKLILQMQVCS